MAGLLLVDGNIPGFFDEAEVARLNERFTPLIPEVEKADPKIAGVMVPIMLALPETAERLRAVRLPPGLPVVDIVPETTWVPTGDEIASLRREHASFVAESAAREAVVATGSGHYVMRDRPDLVLDAAGRLIDRIRGEHATPQVERKPAGAGGSDSPRNTEEIVEIVRDFENATAGRAR